MRYDNTLVSIGLPVRNGAHRMECVVKSVLAQDHTNLELIICDNGSTDDTEQLCRSIAAHDSRVIYHRNPANVGMLNNFMGAMRLATGDFFRWVGDDDWLDPQTLSRCLEAFAADDRLILVTNQLEYVAPDGHTEAAACAGTAWGSDDPVTRFAEVLRLLPEPYFPVDPLYALYRREAVVHIKRRNMLNEDQVFATKLALAGPWGHVPEVTLRRNWTPEPMSALARKLDVPRWQTHFVNTLQCAEMLRWLNECELDRKQLARARRAIARMYLRRQRMLVVHRVRKLVHLARRMVGK
jgi:glycosyltransferase involved in cell wall biosynthesis